ncbi:hypothetical protein Z968_12465 [Clostridium novyi A str. 4552]|uniref:Uncharacterized protein n=1 Tax=Clostridium novyi A str. 4552 TaxID=1444289 RepID=A0A0A0I021_CLONO|nr:hypothetical protein [Clostridium novyi]KGM93676.1 hypothetical protein Z968_12465 [Clostridium novyi A str. 4552]
MAYAFTLSTTSISTDNIVIAVTGKTNPILQSEVNILKYNGSTKTFDNFTTFTVSSASANAATITPNTPFQLTDLLIIQVVEGSNKSDKLLIDFQEAYPSHKASYNYQLPSDTGNYKMNLGKVNGMDFSSVMSNQFEVGNAPDTSNSSIAISKSYLVQFSGSILDVNVTLNNAAGNASEGNYEVTLFADQQ